MVVTNYKDTKKEVDNYKSSDQKAIVYSYTLLQHLDWALSKAGNYVDDVAKVDFSKIGNDEVLYMIAHGPDTGGISGDYDGKQLAAFLCDKTKGIIFQLEEKRDLRNLLLCR